MIDLNYKSKKQKEEPKDPPFVVQLFLLMPFAFLLWVLLTASFLHGIY